MKGPAISPGSWSIFASVFAHLICSFWLRIPHAATFKSTFESALENTGKCQVLLCELELPLLGDAFISLWSLLQVKLVDAGRRLLQRHQCCVLW